MCFVLGICDLYPETDEKKMRSRRRTCDNHLPLSILVSISLKGLESEWMLAWLVPVSGKLEVRRVAIRQPGLTRPSSKSFSLGMLRDIVPFFLQIIFYDKVMF